MNSFPHLRHLFLYIYPLSPPFLQKIYKWEVPYIVHVLNCSELVQGMNMFRDETCAKIFLILLFNHGFQKVRHDELYEESKHFEKLPKSTFNLHLKNHLVEDGWVNRIVEDVQKVTYQINMDKLRRIKDLKRLMEEWRETMMIKKKEFYSLPVEDQIAHAVMWIWLLGLERLKYWILLKTEDKIEHKFMFALLDSGILSVFERLIVRRAVEDEEYRRKVLEKIEASIEKISRDLEA